MPRYIDADTLIQKIDGWREQLAMTYGINDEYVKCLGEVLDIIEDAPTEDVVERKKGKWIHNGSQWKNRFLCSNCNYLWWFPAEEAHYCPNCGSQNEKENENEKA